MEINEPEVADGVAQKEDGVQACQLAAALAVDGTSHPHPLVLSEKVLGYDKVKSGNTKSFCLPTEGIIVSENNSLSVGPSQVSRVSSFHNACATLPGAVPFGENMLQPYSATSTESDRLPKAPTSAKNRSVKSPLTNQKDVGSIIAAPKVKPPSSSASLPPLPGAVSETYTAVGKNKKHADALEELTPFSHATPSRRKRSTRPTPVLTARQIIAAEARLLRQNKRKQQPTKPELNKAKQKKTKLVHAGTSQVNSEVFEPEVGSNSTNCLQLAAVHQSSDNLTTTQNAQSVNWENISSVDMEEYLLEEGGVLDSVVPLQGRVLMGCEMDTQSLATNQNQGAAMYTTATLIGTSVPLWSAQQGMGSQDVYPLQVARSMTNRTGWTHAERVQIQEIVETQVVQRLGE